MNTSTGTKGIYNQVNPKPKTSTRYSEVVRNFDQMVDPKKTEQNMGATGKTSSKSIIKDLISGGIIE